MGILYSLITVSIVLIVIAYAFPILWPIVITATVQVDNMTGTDVGTTTFQAFWPIVLLLVGLGVAVGLIVYAVKRFGLLSGGGGKD